jgi:hypothetical protein
MKRLKTCVKDPQSHGYVLVRFEFKVCFQDVAKQVERLTWASEATPGVAEPGVAEEAPAFARSSSPASQFGSDDPA